MDYELIFWIFAAVFGLVGISYLWFAAEDEASRYVGGAVK